MWKISLHCDGCEELFDGYFMKDPDNFPRGVRNLEARAVERRRWEHVDAPDGEEWYCPTCCRARDGETLTGARPARGTA